MGQSKNYDPDKCYFVEVYETAANGKPRTFGVKDLSLQQAKEYFDRMEPESKFQIFREFPDGTIQKVSFGAKEEIRTQFGIWKRGFINTNGDYQPGALMEICDTEAEANAKLVNYDESHFIEPF